MYISSNKSVPQTFPIPTPSHQASSTKAHSIPTQIQCIINIRMSEPPNFYVQVSVDGTRHTLPRSHVTVPSKRECEIGEVAEGAGTLIDR